MADALLAAVMLRPFGSTALSKVRRKECVMRVAAFVLGFCLSNVWPQCTQAQCPDPDNLIHNCGFETDTQGWILYRGNSLTRSTADSRSGVACAEGEAGIFVPFTLELGMYQEWIPVSGSVDILAGAYFKLVTETQSPIWCGLNYGFFDGCPGAEIEIDSGGWIETNTTTWTLSSAKATTHPDTQCMSIYLYCSAAFQDFIVRIDDVYIFIAVFIDGFESGDLTAWSAVEP